MTSNPVVPVTRSFRSVSEANCSSIAGFTELPPPEIVNPSSTVPGPSPCFAVTAASPGVA